MKKRRRTLLSSFLIFNFSFLLLSSCSIEKKIGKSAKTDVLGAKALQTAHVGISIYDPAMNKYWFNHQGDKYFVPASNIKIPTCYAAMKYLGDSLVGVYYNIARGAKAIRIIPNGDPTFLLESFKNQPVYDFMKTLEQFNIGIDLTIWKEEPLGSGWSWNDYEEYYMTERSAMPIFGNMIRFSGKLPAISMIPKKAVKEFLINSEDSNTYIKVVRRILNSNYYEIKGGGNELVKRELTFSTDGGKIIADLLEDTLKVSVGLMGGNPTPQWKKLKFESIKTQPTDSVLKPMMHRSDNFFAEQMLLMVSNENLGFMIDARIIDTILKTDFKDLPQKPRWADGSGLSRYNLFTPQDFVAILNKMKNEFGMERLKVILPTGGEGTISSYYKADSGYIYGKTGTLSGVVAFSGFMYTKKGKLLIFSTLINNHQASATDVRRVIEKFLQGIRNSY